MKSFLYKLILFLLPVFFFPLFLYFSFVYVEKNVQSKIRDIAGYECLIMGDSQMRRFNPVDFSQRTYNFASSGEHFYFTYSKLKMVLANENNNIKRVILGVSAHNFAPVYQKLMDLKFIEGKSSMEKYLYFVDPLDNSLFDIKNVFYQKNFISGVFFGPDWGGYYHSTYKNPNMTIIDETLNMHYQKSSGLLTDIRSQKYYLEKIVECCKKNGVELVFVSTPYHSAYKRKVDKKYFNILKKVISGQKGIIYLNYLDDQTPDSFMSDGNHLNVTGAKFYAKLINDKLK